MTFPGDLDASDPNYVCPLCGPGEYPEGYWYTPGYFGCRVCQDHHRSPECPIEPEPSGLPELFPA